jgi:hypothetical protein
MMNKSPRPQGGDERLMKSGWKDRRKMDVGKKNGKRRGGRRVFIG